MKDQKHRPFTFRATLDRRDFLKIGGIAGTGLLLGNPALWAQESQKPEPPPRPRTNIDDVLKIPKVKYSLPGLFPGKVAVAHDPASLSAGQPDAAVVERMFARGLTALTGKKPKKSFRLFFNRDDVVGIKVNPVGPGLIATHVELVATIASWLTENGIPPAHVVIWDRFDYMLHDAGFTAERFPGMTIEGLQTMDEATAEGKTQDNSRWLRPDGTHVSTDNFDMNAFYFADVEGPKDMASLNQHVFGGKYSYFGKLLTQKLTKIINVPVFKNTGNGISMASKNLGYGAICNTSRLHRPLFFDVCTEVLAFPVIRDKLVLNVTDGIHGQYDGGPGPAAQFTFPLHTLFLATDPFALDSHCHRLMVHKRKHMGVKVNEHPKFTEYLRYAERLGLGVADPAKIRLVTV